MTDYVSILEVKLYGAKKLPSADFNGTSDPYVVLRCGKQEVRSSVVDKSLSPFWNETLRICIPSKEAILKMEVWDKDQAASDDFLGEATIHLGEIIPDQQSKGIKHTVVLFGKPSKKKKKQKKPEKQPKQPKEKGRVFIKLTNFVMCS